MSWSKKQAARDLREQAAQITDDEEVALVQSIADYVEATADTGDGLRPGAEKRLLSEVAMAYAEGYEHATGDRPREAWAALRKVGLSL